MALFNTKGKQIAVYQELAQNDFMSTLAITTGTVKAGNYVLVVQCQSSESSKINQEFTKAALTIFKGVDEPEGDVEEPTFLSEEKKEERGSNERRMKKSEHSNNKPSAEVQAVIDAGAPWTDKDFPPNKASLSPKGTFNFKWARVTEIM